MWRIAFLSSLVSIANVAAELIVIAVLQVILWCCVGNKFAVVTSSVLYLIIGCRIIWIGTSFSSYDSVKGDISFGFLVGLWCVAADLCLQREACTTGPEGDRSGGRREGGRGSGRRSGD